MATTAILNWAVSPFSTPAEIAATKQPGGWLQLTQAAQHPDRGSIESTNAFDTANNIIHLEFDYLSWGGNGGQGAAIYLFDTNVAGAGTGGIGGVGLGYVKMVGAYIGIGLDESSSFTLINPGTMTENSRDVSTGSSVTVRGSQARNYAQDSVNNLPASPPLFYNAAQHATRDAAIAAGGVKRVIVTFTPNTPLPGYTVTLSINGVVFLDNFNYPHAAPASAKLGITATNGERSSNHEIRNMRATLTRGVNLLRGVIAYIQHGTSPNTLLFNGNFLIDGDRVHLGWNGSGGWDQYPPDYLDCYLIILGGIELNTLIIYCRSDDFVQVEPSDTTTFTQHGAIDFVIDGQDANSNIFNVAAVSGNNLVMRTLTIPNERYINFWICVSKAASFGPSIVEIEGYKL
jgi:hypothetical protein